MQHLQPKQPTRDWEAHQCSDLLIYDLSTAALLLQLISLVQTITLTLKEKYFQIRWNAQVTPLESVAE